MDKEEVWQAVLGLMELNVSQGNFATWFKHTSIVRSNEGEYVIGVPNGFTKEWLKNKYHKQIAEGIQNITSQRVKKISYELVSENAGVKPESKSVKTLPSNRVIIEEKNNIDNETNLNKKYTFHNFVVGPSNELAKAAGVAVTQNLGTVYNPLFIHGGVGLGKTHLVQAIGNAVRKNHPEKRVIYVTCEKFTNDFIHYIRQGKASSTVFKNRYRSVDVIIIDDIQFLSGKEGTQEEFFHTFNTLYQNNRQIILTSDRPPKAIQDLEKRLVSRFEGGMIADVGSPDFETRKAILEEKCQAKGIELNEEILTYMATNIKDNIRELEGALSRVMAKFQLCSDNSPSLDSVKSVLDEVIKSPKTQAITPKKVVETVSVFYDLEKSNLIAKTRKKEVAWPRQIAMYIMREELKTSYPAIGQEVGGRDHTTAMHAYEKVVRAIKNNDDIRQEIDLIKQRLYSN